MQRRLLGRPWYPVPTHETNPLTLDTPATGDLGTDAPPTAGAPIHPGAIPSQRPAYPPEVLDLLARRYPPMPAPTPPTFGHAVDTLRTTDLWRYLSDYMVSGTITPSTSAAVTAALTLPAGSAALKLNQYPRTSRAYLCVRHFSFAPVASTATGAYVFTYTDPSGNVAPLGTYTAGQGGQLGAPVIAPSPLTDPTNLSMGTLTVTMVTGATPVVVSYAIGFTVVYLLAPEPLIRAAHVALEVSDGGDDDDGSGLDGEGA